MLSKDEKLALTKLLESGDKHKCLNYFRGMTEKQRQECFAVVKSFRNQVKKASANEHSPESASLKSLENSAFAAYFATAPGPEIIKAKLSGRLDPDCAFQIFSDRKPAWIDQWVEMLLSDTHYWVHWPLIRRLILAGVATKPANPRYYLGMISGLNAPHGKADLISELEAHPDLLEEDVWKLFEYDGEGENSLSNTERFFKSWIDAFLALINKGKLSRTRFMSACVDALERDFNHYRAKWFFEMFDRLEPTDEEVEKQAHRLLGLLGVSASNVAAWALNRVENLMKSGRLPSQNFCQSIEPLLLARTKAPALTALQLLNTQALSNPSDSTPIAITAAQALGHDAADVQKAAIKLLDSIAQPNDEGIRSIVEKHYSTLSPSVQKIAGRWMDHREEKAPASKTSPTAVEIPSKSTKPTHVHLGLVASNQANEIDSLYAIDQMQRNLDSNIHSIPAAIFDGTEIPRLASQQPIVPINSLDELIEVCARVIEDGSLVDDAERCIDGLARMASDRPKNFEQLTAPLLKRVRKLISSGCTPFCGTDPSHDIMGLFYAFCTGKVIELKPTGTQLSIQFEGIETKTYKVNQSKPIGFLSAHCQEVAGRIASGQATQLFSTPTHSAGWIDPCVLASRANAWKNIEPSQPDVILAMLRLAPENRADALKSLEKHSSEWIRAIRHALGEEGIEIGGNSGLWIAAARARTPWLDDLHVQQKHAGLGPDAAEAAKLGLSKTTQIYEKNAIVDFRFDIFPTIPASNDPLLATVTFYTSQSIDRSFASEMGGFAGRTTGAVRWTATIWPLARESFFAASIVHCFLNLDWWYPEWQNRTMLEPLIDRATPLRTSGLIFLAGMLAAKEPGESGLATDIAIRAIEDGRLGSDNFGFALATLLNMGFIKPARMQKSLSEISRISKVHAYVVQLALQHCFEAPNSTFAKESGKLLELLYELSLELGIAVTNKNCRDWLSSGSTTGKSSKIAKTLLSLEDTLQSKESCQAILRQAIALRTNAAQRNLIGNTQ